MPGLRAQQDADFLEGGIPGRAVRCDRHLGKQRMVPFTGTDQPGYFAGRRDDIGEPGSDRAARHGIELGGFRRLHQGQAAALADRREAGRSIRTHAGQDDADRLFATVFGQAGKKGVDRQVQPVPGRHLEQVKRPVQDRNVLVGRNDIDAIRLDPHPVCRLLHGHRRGTLQQFREHAGALGVEVLDDDKGHAAVCRDAREQLFQRFQPAGRGPDADDRERHVVRCGFGVSENRGGRHVACSGRHLRFTRPRLPVRVPAASVRASRAAAGRAGTD